MARIASESKGGFYATPLDEMALVLKSLIVEPSLAENSDPRDFFIYDPCCGQGVALSMLHKEMQRKGAKSVFAYGAELEEGRAQLARDELDFVLHDGYQNVRTEAKFSLLWLNPPYQDSFNERTELTFLRALTSAKTGVLMKGGILLFCIPQYVLVSTAGVLSARFSDLQVFRFTDENYDVFKQVVVVGRYGKMTQSEQKRMYKSLIAIGEGEKDILPTLEDMTEFVIPPCDQVGVPMFRAGVLDIQELSRDMATSPLLNDITKRVVAVGGSVVMKRPLLPLKPAHMGVAIAAGAVGGNMGSHIITGVTKQRIDVEAIIDEDTGHKKGERKTFHYTSIVRAFTEQGVVDLV